MTSCFATIVSNSLLLIRCQDLRAASGIGISVPIGGDPTGIPDGLGSITCWNGSSQPNEGGVQEVGCRSDHRSALSNRIAQLSGRIVEDRLVAEPDCRLATS